MSNWTTDDVEFMDEGELKEALATLSGHSDAVQCCTFDKKGSFLLTGGSDATLRLWC